MLFLLFYPQVHIETCYHFSFVHFGLTQNEPTPKVHKTHMEDPYGKSQERPRVFRKSFVVLLNAGGTKDLQEGFVFELLRWHTSGRSITAWWQCWGWGLGVCSRISRSLKLRVYFFSF